MTVRPERALSLPAQPVSARESRSFVRSVLVAWGLPGLTDDASLMVSELVANAVVHARTPVTVTVSWRLPGDQVRVTVHDHSPMPPLLRDVDLTSTTGRGMHIVDALAQSSGVALDTAGKDVWFELSCEGAGEVGPVQRSDAD